MEHRTPRTFHAVSSISVANMRRWRTRCGGPAGKRPPNILTANLQRMSVRAGAFSSCSDSTPPRHARARSQACAGCINLPARASTSFRGASQTWMAGTSPAMTNERSSSGGTSSSQPADEQPPLLRFGTCDLPAVFLTVPRRVAQDGRSHQQSATQSADSRGHASLRLRGAFLLPGLASAGHR